MSKSKSVSGDQWLERVGKVRVPKTEAVDENYWQDCGPELSLTAFQRREDGAYPPVCSNRGCGVVLSNEQVEALAFHEAGHVVAAIAFGLTLRKTRAATILPHGGTFGCACANGIYPKLRCVRAFLLAGPVAEKLFSGVSTVFGSEDIVSYVRLCAALRFFSFPDAIQKSSHYQMLEEQLSKRWNEVDAIAKALLEKNALTRDEVLALYSAASKAERKTPPTSLKQR